MTTIIAQNVHRAYVTALAGDSMASDFMSEPIDFKEMLSGCIQAKWSGNDAADGTLTVYGSAVPDLEWFAPLNCGTKTLDEDGTPGNEKTQMFDLGQFGFRYARVKYSKGSNTTGTITIIAQGKKGG